MDVILTGGPNEPVRTVTLDRPAKRNALTGGMFAALTAEFAQPPPAARRVTVLRARGAAFCAGVDLTERLESAGPAHPNPLERLCRAVREYPLPVVAVVGGAAIGGGMMLALHADFVVAAEDALIGNAAVQLGLVPAWAPSRTVREVAGSAAARRLLLLGDPVTAAELARTGVIHAAVPTARLAAAADAVVARLAANAPLSLRATKATLTARPVVDHCAADDLIAQARRSPDSREGIRARKEKRPPRFTGR